MPAGHPLQRLPRCTGHKESDDAFWDIMDWNSEDEGRKKAKQLEKTKENTTGQGAKAAAAHRHTQCGTTPPWDGPAQSRSCTRRAEDTRQYKLVLKR